MCKTSTLYGLPRHVHASGVRLSQLPVVLWRADRLPDRELDFDDSHELARLPVDRLGDGPWSRRLRRAVSRFRDGPVRGRISRPMGSASCARRDANALDGAVVRAGDSDLHRSNHGPRDHRVERSSRHRQCFRYARTSGVSADDDLRPGGSGECHCDEFVDVQRRSADRSVGRRVHDCDSG